MLIFDPKTKPQKFVFKRKKNKLEYIREHYIWCLVVLMIMVLAAIGVVASQNGQNEMANINDRQPENTASSAPIVVQYTVKSSDPAVPSSSESEMIHLKVNDKVVFVGDSMMQGIAPYVQKWLKSEYQLDGIDLSRHSTGLSNPQFFDWQNAVTQAFNTHKDLKLMIILIGINDARDLPNPNANPPIARFKTPDWEKIYLARVNEMVQAAKKANAKILWLGIPHVKNPVLNEKMAYLDELLENELQKEKEHVLWLKTSDLLSDGEKKYQENIVLDGESVVIRANDGIHLNARGQQFMADYIASYLNVQSP